MKNVWIDRLLESPTGRAVELAARFAEERHNVLAENVANIDSPGYATKSLDARAFQRSLAAALRDAGQGRSPKVDFGGGGSAAGGAGPSDEAGEAVDTGAISAGEGANPAGERADGAWPGADSGGSERGSDALTLTDNPQFRVYADGRVEVTPDTDSAQNVLFHDGTNARIEKLMTEASENGLYYQVATNFMKSRYDSLMAAIRGRP